MFDANAKFPSGVLNGNINQFGDFDQCMGVASRNSSFKGQYCLVTIQPMSMPENEKHLNVIKKLVLAKESHKSEFEDVRVLTLMKIFMSLTGFH